MDYKSGGLIVKDNTRCGEYQSLDSKPLEKVYEKISIDLYDLPDLVVVRFYVDYPHIKPSCIDHYVLCPSNMNPQEYLNTINIEPRLPLKYKSESDLYTHCMRESRSWYESVKRILDYNLVNDDLHISKDCFHFQCIDIIMCNYNTRKRYQELSTLYDDLFTTEDEDDDLEERKVVLKRAAVPVFLTLSIIGSLLMSTAVILSSVPMLLTGFGIFVILFLHLLFIKN